MLCFCSIADNHTGVFLGCVVLNRLTMEEAADSATQLLPPGTCAEVLVWEIPPGAPPVPGEVVGRFLSRAQAEQAFGYLESVRFNTRQKISPAHQSSSTSPALPDR